MKFTVPSLTFAVCLAVSAGVRAAESDPFPKTARVVRSLDDAKALKKHDRAVRLELKWWIDERGPEYRETLAVLATKTQIESLDLGVYNDLRVDAGGAAFARLAALPQLQHLRLTTNAPRRHQKVTIWDGIEKMRRLETLDLNFS